MVQDMEHLTDMVGVWVEGL